ncbi:hypothetical protein FOL47_002773 [Perkinsus chesapeaki]|uniref:Uncharacterized protein n=1 Tax=Perkinsus chesapeaki TaxID=330153 RepID=A0A7J6N1C4_PERCH|nr:hypothetical protein FOL47_002773 [Perkinsus chesapeaki]
MICLLLPLVHLGLSIVSSQPPSDCLRIGSLSETSDSRMFELPHRFDEIRTGNSSNITSSSNCGMHFTVGDTLCIGARELTVSAAAATVASVKDRLNEAAQVRRKWGLVIQLGSDHRAYLGQNFTWGTCQLNDEDGRRQRRVLMQGLHHDSRLYLDGTGQRQASDGTEVHASVCHGRLLVTHPSKRLVYLYHSIPSHFTHAGNRKRVDVVAGEDGKLLYPSDIALLEFNGVTSTGQPGRYYGYVVVCDMHAHRVVLYPPPGTASPASMARVIAGSSGGLPGADLSSLNSPNAIAIDPDAPLSELPYSSLFISDSGNDRIVRWRFGAVRGEIVAFTNARDLLLRPSGLFVATSTEVLLLQGRSSDTCPVLSSLMNQFGNDQCTAVDQKAETSSTSLAPLRLSINVESYPRHLLRENRTKLAPTVTSVDAEASEVYTFAAPGKVSFGQSPDSLVIVSDGGNDTSLGWVNIDTELSFSCGGCSALVVNAEVYSKDCTMFSIQPASGELVEWHNHDCVSRKD